MPEPILLPPSADVCQACARAHDPRMPHDASTLYFQYHWYYSHDHTWPTWRDGMEHCEPEMRAQWIEALEERGIDVDKPAFGEQPVEPLSEEEALRLQEGLKEMSEHLGGER